MSGEELVPFDIGPACYPDGTPFRNAVSRNPPGPAAEALGRALAGAASEEEAAEIYLSALVRAGVVTEAEAQELTSSRP